MLSVVPYLANGLSFWDIPSLTSFGLMSIFERYLGKVLSKFIMLSSHHHTVRTYRTPCDKDGCAQYKDTAIFFD